MTRHVMSTVNYSYIHGYMHRAVVGSASQVQLVQSTSLGDT